LGVNTRRTCDMNQSMRVDLAGLRNTKYGENADNAEDPDIFVERNRVRTRDTDA